MSLENIKKPQRTIEIGGRPFRSIPDSKSDLDKHIDPRFQRVLDDQARRRPLVGNERAYAYDSGDLEAGKPGENKQTKNG